MTKNEEKHIHRQFVLLRNHLRRQRKETKEFLRTRCKTLRRAVSERWQYDEKVLLDEALNDSVRCFMKDIKEL